jgi:hypothetical protein
MFTIVDCSVSKNEVVEINQVSDLQRDFRYENWRGIRIGAFAAARTIVRVNAEVVRECSGLSPKNFRNLIAPFIIMTTTPLPDSSNAILMPSLKIT